MRFILFAVLALTTGCSYFQRKSCESRNWHKLAEEIALRGEFLDSDPEVRQCREVGAEVSAADMDLGFKKGRARYCSEDYAFTRGTKGETYSLEICDGVNAKRLTKRHQDGVKQYCSPTNAERIGAAGEILKSELCPIEGAAEREASYKTGRNRFLRDDIVRKESRISDLHREIRRLERQRSDKAIEASRARDAAKKLVKRSVYDPERREYREETSLEEDQIKKSQADRLESEVKSMGEEIDAKENEIASLEKTIANMKVELNSK